MNQRGRTAALPGRAAALPVHFSSFAHGVRFFRDLLRCNLCFIVLLLSAHLEGPMGKRPTNLSDAPSPHLAGSFSRWTPGALSRVPLLAFVAGANACRAAALSTLSARYTTEPRLRPSDHYLRVRQLTTNNFVRIEKWPGEPTTTFEYLSDGRSPCRVAANRALRSALTFSILLLLLLHLRAGHRHASSAADL
jgi:hypothetical protein